jgi:hypothetical protein
MAIDASYHILKTVMMTVSVDVITGKSCMVTGEECESKMAPRIDDTSINPRTSSPQSVIHIVKIIHYLLHGHIPEKFAAALMFPYFFKIGARNGSDNYRSISIYLWLYGSFLILYTVGRTPWTGDQPVARPLPTHRTTQTQKLTQTSIA